MRLAIRDIDDFPVTPGDLSDLSFEGSPERVAVESRGATKKAIEYLPVQGVTLDRPTGTTSRDKGYSLQGIKPPSDVVARWGRGAAFLHVVAYHYCTLDEILDYGDEQRKSPRGRGCTEEQAFKARAVAENEVELICKRTFRATYKSLPVYGTKFQSPWPVGYVLSRGFSILGESIVFRDCQCSRFFEFITGADQGVPLDLRRACVALAAQKLMPSLIPDRATGQTTDAGTIRFTLASATSTGLPDVDAVLARYKRSGQVLL